MFWNKKNKLPITIEDQIWVEESLSFLKDTLGTDKIISLRTLLPTEDFFSRDFDKTEKDAYFILKQCQKIMDIKEDRITLEFYSDANRHLDDGTVVISNADHMGRSEGAAGTYQKTENKSFIRLDRAQLKHTENLIATISHELAHEKLLGENKILKNDEYLTDLTAIVYGFGVFIANAKFQFKSGTNNGFGWQIKSQGYLPEQIIAYAMASLDFKKKKVNQDYKSYLNNSTVKHFNKSIAYLKSDNNTTDNTLFWAQNSKKKPDQFIENLDKESEVVKREFTKLELDKLQLDLNTACTKDDFDAVEHILKQGVSPNFVKVLSSPFSIAISRNNIEMVELLRQYGVDINTLYSEDILVRLPLIQACSHSNTHMAAYLIQIGAEVNVVTKHGDSPLAVAIQQGNIELCELILNAGANIELKSGDFLKLDKTPICVAVMSNKPEIVSLLAKHGAKTKPIRKLTRHEIHPKMVKFLKVKKTL